MAINKLLETAESFIEKAKDTYRHSSLNAAASAIYFELRGLYELGKVYVKQNTEIIKLLKEISKNTEKERPQYAPPRRK